MIADIYILNRIDNAAVEFLIVLPIDKRHRHRGETNSAILPMNYPCGRLP